MTIAPSRPRVPKQRSAVPIQPASEFRPGFRADIEGLRAIGVLLVVAFHAAVPHLAGGFVGVDVFFVISGFLITGLLMREWDTTGRISLQDFYARRVRRILPAACVVLAATAVAMPFFLDPLRAYRTVLDLAASLLYVGNWRFIHQNNDYLAASNDHSPALHYWSLSVEEQFYLVWPLLIVVGTGLALRRHRNATGLVVVVLGAVVAGSFALSLHQTHSNPNLAYMATTTRAWQFGVGGLLALVLRSAGARFHAAGRAARVGLWVIGWLGALDLALAAVHFDRTTIYPGTAALLPTLGAAAIILSGSAGVLRGGFGALLSLPPIRWIGRVSYSWYLWHWPVIVLALAKWPRLGLLDRVGLMAGALCLAWLTQRFIELPAVRLRLLRSHGRSALVALLFTLIAGTAVGVTGVSLRTDLVGQAGAAVKLPSFQAVFGATTHRNSGAVAPSPLKAASDVPTQSDCLVERGTDTPHDCIFGPARGLPVVLLGDSHMQQWQSPLVNLAQTQKWRLHVVTHGSCPAALFRSGETSGSLASGCEEWRTDQLLKIKSLHPSVVIVSSQNRRGLSQSVDVAAWSRTFSALRATGAKIIYLQDTVTPPSDVPSCVAAHLEDWKHCAFKVRSSGQPNYVAWEKHSVAVPGVSVVNMLRYLCPDGVCPAVSNGVLLYRDDSHISDTAARILQGALARQLVPLVDEARSTPAKPS